MLKVGVFGVGHLGKFHLNNWKEIPGVELLGFMIRMIQMQMKYSEKYKLKRFDDAGDLIELRSMLLILSPQLIIIFVFVKLPLKKANMFL